MHHVFAVIRIAVVATLMALAGAAHAAPTLWVTDITGHLGKVDAATGAVEVVGAMGISMTDIAFDPSGQLYGTSPFDLYRIDTATAVPTLVGSLTGSLGNTITSLVFAPDGTLYGGNNTLHTINTTTGATTELGNAGASYNSGDLAFVGGQLYASSYDFINGSLYRVNLATGAGEAVGLTGTGELGGLATAADGTLYGVSGTSVYTIDTTTGAGTLLGSFGGQGLGETFGMAILADCVPAVPEPSSYLMVLAGLAVFGMVGRQRAPSHLNVHAA